MKALTEALNTLLSKISDFFDIFDLSFFISGITVVSAVIFMLHQDGWTEDLPAYFSGVKLFLFLALACYISGLICFALGRWLRNSIEVQYRKRNTQYLKTYTGKYHQDYVTQGFAEFDERFKSILQDHNLHGVPSYQPYFAAHHAEQLQATQQRPIWRLYVRCWAEIRQTPQLASSLSLLRRYWVMAATYDGLAIAVFVWLAALLHFACRNYPVWYFIGFCVVIIPFFVILARACSREAGRYVRYQVEELAATIAAHKECGFSASEHDS